MNARLRSQLEELLAKGLHTEERVAMFGTIKELLSFEEQLDALMVRATGVSVWAPPPSCVLARQF